VIELVGDLLRNPILPANALEEVRQQALSRIEQSRKEPQALVSNTLERYGNPYPVGDLRAARTFDELVADLQAVNIEQVREIHRQFLGASNAQFAAVGAMDEAAVNAALARALGAWVSKTLFERAPRPLIPLTPMRQVLETPDKQNANLATALAAVRVDGV
jgi:zinc protease